MEVVEEVMSRKIRIRDPVPFLPLDPGSGMGKKSRSRIIFPESLLGLETILWVKVIKFFDADPGPGSGNLFIRDGKNSDPG
jgi:hypothetical protein